MAQGDAQEKTEEASARKKSEARKKGSVAHSVDLTGSLAMLAVILIFPMAMDKIRIGGMETMTIGLRSLPSEITMSLIGRRVLTCAMPLLTGFALVVGSVMLVGTAASTAQVGFVLSGEALKPNFNRMNPMEGFKRLFSRTAWFEAFKSLFKSILVALLAYSVISDSWGRLLSLGGMPLEGAASVTCDVVRSLLVRIVFAWLALAGLDYFFQKKKLSKDLMMSKQELKEEMKEFETNPEVRMAQARRRRQLAKGSLMQTIKNADVILTNPTHYAVALEYDAAKSTAPIVIAKGADHLAARIRELASEHGVPIVPNPPLTRALYHRCDIGDAVPKELFQPVAEVLAYVYRTLRRVRKGGSTGAAAGSPGPRQARTAASSGNA